MRTIKFRAWDGKEMFNINVLALAECGWSCDKGRGVSIPYQPSIEVMQFTGLLDKNGKEIFEGDIILAHEKGKNYPLNYIVVFSETQLGFRLRWVGRTKSQEDSRGFYDQLISESKHEKFEVIGNVHETPELLK